MALFSICLHLARTAAIISKMNVLLSIFQCIQFTHSTAHRSTNFRCEFSIWMLVLKIKISTMYECVCRDEKFAPQTSTKLSQMTINILLLMHIWIYTDLYIRSESIKQPVLTLEYANQKMLPYLLRSNTFTDKWIQCSTQ